MHIHNLKLNSLLADYICCSVGSVSNAITFEMHVTSIEGSIPFCRCNMYRPMLSVSCLTLFLVSKSQLNSFCLKLDSWTQSTTLSHCLRIVCLHRIERKTKRCFWRDVSCIFLSRGILVFVLIIMLIRIYPFRQNYETKSLRMARVEEEEHFPCQV